MTGHESVFMKEMKEQTQGIIEDIEGLSDTFLKLTLARITRKTVNLTAGILNILLVYAAGAFGLLFLAFGLAWWIGDLLNNRVAGFFIIAGLFALIILFIILFRKTLVYPFIRNVLVRKIYE